MEELSNEGIARGCEAAEAFLAKCGAERKEALRLQLMLEEVLLDYQKRFGAGAAFELKTKKLLGKIQLIVTLAGESMDPFAARESGELAMVRRLQNGMSGAASWSYRSGVNTVYFAAKKQRKLSSPAKTILAMALAVPLGLACASLPEAARETLLSDFVTPTLGTLMGIIAAVAGPMIFFSLLWGICTIGDVDTLSRIGKRMIGRFLLALIVLTVIVSLVCVPFFLSADTGGASFRLSDFYRLLLGIIPSNMIAPFVEGNTQQIIFLAVVGGVVLLLLGERASAVTAFSGHMNAVVQHVMGLANTLIPLLVFLSIFKIVAGGEFSAVARAYKVLPVFLVLSVLLLLLSTAYTALRLRVSMLTLVRRAAPVFIIALTTASSAAALPRNLDDCEHAFGIDRRIVSFGIPLGQTLYKPGVLPCFVAVGYGMAELYGVSITASWVVVLIVAAFLLGVSTPPVVGGSAVSFAILFEQLGVPADAIGLTLALNVLFDFVITAADLYCLQMSLARLAGSLDMLDRKALAGAKGA